MFKTGKIVEIRINYTFLTFTIVFTQIKKKHCKIEEFLKIFFTGRFSRNSLCSEKFTFEKSGFGVRLYTIQFLLRLSFDKTIHTCAAALSNVYDIRLNEFHLDALSSRRTKKFMKKDHFSCICVIFRRVRFSIQVEGS